MAESNSIQVLTDKLNQAGIKKQRIKSSDLTLNKKLEIVELVPITTRFGRCILAEFESFTYILPSRYTKEFTEKDLEFVNSKKCILYMTVSGFNECGGYSSPIINFQSKDCGN